MSIERPLGDELTLALERMTATFEQRSIRYAVIGGIATLLRGRPRFTQDVDFILEVPQIVLPGLLDELVAQGFDLDPLKVIREYVYKSITAFRFGEVRIDWLKPALPLYARALSDATMITWKNGQLLRVATPEGIILTKMLAYRPQDIADIETLLVSNPGLDTELIRREWALFASNDPSRTAWLEDAIRRLAPTP